MGFWKTRFKKLEKWSYLPLSPASQLDLTPNGSLSSGGLRLSMFSLLPMITGANLLRLLILFPTRHSGICIISVNLQAQARTHFYRPRSVWSTYGPVPRDAFRNARTTLRVRF